MDTVLVTGANGFVGRALCDVLAASGHRVRRAVRLTGSLQVDSSRIRRELGWEPRYSLTRGLEESARWYHAQSA